MEEQEFEPQYPAQYYTKRPNPNAILSPLYDSTFKTMFTLETKESNLALKSFISAVLNRTISEVTIKPNEPPKETTEQRGMLFDICVQFDNGEISDIEMQAFKQKYDYGMRSEIQVARLLSNNVIKGDDWNSSKVYQISVLNFHYRQDDTKELVWYTLKDDSGKELTNRQNIIFIDLINIRKKFGLPVEKLTPIEKWGLFLSYVDDPEKAEYVSNLIRSEKGIMAAEKTVKDMSEADDNWWVQNSLFIAERDRNTVIHNAEKRGLEAGMQQKAVEDAVMLIKDYAESPEVAAQKMNAPLELVMEELSRKKR